MNFINVLTAVVCCIFTLIFFVLFLLALAFEWWAPLTWTLLALALIAGLLGYVLISPEEEEDEEEDTEAVEGTRETV